MKNFIKNTLLFSISLMLFVACKKSSESQKLPSFLIVNWIRIQEDTTTTTHEFWTDELKGLGFTLQNKDTVFKEILHFETKNDSTFLIVMVENESITKFLITQQTDTSFVCENPKHDFPKTIKYWLSNKQLNAKVYNDEFGIDFVFEKMK